MNDTPQFTVVLAGHQCEPYLAEALASVANQTFPDLEAICYVEESADNSLALCREQARRDARFTVVSAPKSGAVASTRNYAVDHARGAYLIALDGDDFLAADMLEKLARKLRETGPVDVLAFAGVATPEDTAGWEKMPRLSNFGSRDASGVFSGREALRRAGRHGGQFRSYTCLAAYRTEFLRTRRLYQSAGRLMEDFEWTPRVWFAAERFAYLDEVFYIYRRRAGSLTTEGSSRLVFDLARQLRSLLAFATATPIPDDLLAIWSNQWLATFYWFLFHPVSSRKIANRDRREALAILLAGSGAARLRKLGRRASGPKRAALPLLHLAARGMVWPAWLYFRWLYYPLNALRTRRRHAAPIR